LIVPHVNSENERELDVPEKNFVVLQDELRERVNRYYNRRANEKGSQSVNLTDLENQKHSDLNKLE
jgi:hypothetical protein